MAKSPRRERFEAMLLLAGQAEPTCQPADLTPRHSAIFEVKKENCKSTLSNEIMSVLALTFQQQQKQACDRNSFLKGQKDQGPCVSSYRERNNSALLPSGLILLL